MSEYSNSFDLSEIVSGFKSAFSEVTSGISKTVETEGNAAIEAGMKRIGKGKYTKINIDGSSVSVDVKDIQKSLNKELGKINVSGLKLNFTSLLSGSSSDIRKLLTSAFKKSYEAPDDKATARDLNRLLALSEIRGGVNTSYGKRIDDKRIDYFSMFDGVEEDAYQKEFSYIKSKVGTYYKDYFSKINELYSNSLKDNALEQGFYFDAKNNISSKIKTGISNGLSTKDMDGSLYRGGSFVHSHPNAYSFSPDDLKIAYRMLTDNDIQEQYLVNTRGITKLNAKKIGAENLQKIYKKMFSSFYTAKNGEIFLDNDEAYDSLFSDENREATISKLPSILGNYLKSKNVSSDDISSFLSDFSSKLRATSVEDDDYYGYIEETLKSTDMSKLPLIGAKPEKNYQEYASIIDDKLMEFYGDNILKSSIQSVMGKNFNVDSVLSEISHEEFLKVPQVLEYDNASSSDSVDALNQEAEDAEKAAEAEKKRGEAKKAADNTSVSESTEDIKKESESIKEETENLEKLKEAKKEASDTSVSESSEEIKKESSAIKEETENLEKLKEAKKESSSSTYSNTELEKLKSYVNKNNLPDSDELRNLYMDAQIDITNGKSTAEFHIDKIIAKAKELGYAYDEASRSFSKIENSVDTSAIEKETENIKENVSEKEKLAEVNKQVNTETPSDSSSIISNETKAIDKQISKEKELLNVKEEASKVNSNANEEGFSFNDKSEEKLPVSYAITGAYKTNFSKFSTKDTRNARDEYLYDYENEKLGQKTISGAINGFKYYNGLLQAFEKFKKNKIKASTLESLNFEGLSEEEAKENAKMYTARMQRLVSGKGLVGKVADSELEGRNRDNALFKNAIGKLGGYLSEDGLSLPSEGLSIVNKYSQSISNGLMRAEEAIKRCFDELKELENVSADTSDTDKIADSAEKAVESVDKLSNKKKEFSKITISSQNSELDEEVSSAEKASKAEEDLANARKKANESNKASFSASKNSDEEANVSRKNAQAKNEEAESIKKVNEEKKKSSANTKSSNADAESSKTNAKAKQEELEAIEKVNSEKKQSTSSASKDDAKISEDNANAKQKEAEAIEKVNNAKKQESSSTVKDSTIQEETESAEKLQSTINTTVDNLDKLARESSLELVYDELSEVHEEFTKLSNDLSELMGKMDISSLNAQLQPLISSLKEVNEALKAMGDNLNVADLIKQMSTLATSMREVFNTVGASSDITSKVKAKAKEKVNLSELTNNAENLLNTKQLSEAGKLETVDDLQSRLDYLKGISKEYQEVKDALFKADGGAETDAFKKVNAVFEQITAQIVLIQSLIGQSKIIDKIKEMREEAEQAGKTLDSISKAYDSKGNLKEAVVRTSSTSSDSEDATYTKINYDKNANVTYTSKLDTNDFAAKAKADNQEIIDLYKQASSVIPTYWQAMTKRMSSSSSQWTTEEREAVELVERAFAKMDDNRDAVNQGVSNTTKALDAIKNFESSLNNKGENSISKMFDNAVKSAEKLAEKYKEVKQVQDALTNAVSASNASKGLDYTDSSVFAEQYQSAIDITKQIEEAQQYAIKRTSLQSSLSKLSTSADNINTSKNTDAYTARIEALKAKVKELKVEFDKVGDSKGLEEIEGKAKKLEAELKTLKNTQNDAYNVSAKSTATAKYLEDITRVMNQNSAMSSELKGRFQALYDEINSGASRSKGEMAEFAEQFMKLKTEMYATGQTGKGFFQTIGGHLKSTNAQFISTYFSMMDFVRYGREAFSMIEEVDTAMAELYRVTDLSSQKYSELYDEMAQGAQDYATTVSDMVNSTASWVRLGFDADTAVQMADISAMYQNVTDLDADTANDNLVTAYKGFQESLLEQNDGDSTKAMQSIVDIYDK